MNNPFKGIFKSPGIEQEKRRAALSKIQRLISLTDLSPMERQKFAAVDLHDWTDKKVLDTLKQIRGVLMAKR